MNVSKKLLSLLVVILACAACAGDKDASHTTATTVVPPPPRQVLQVQTRPAVPTSVGPVLKIQADPNKPLMFFNLPDGKTFREGEEVVIDFSLSNAKLRGDGGDFRVRYIVDDDDMKWLERWEQVILTGWLPGKHTIRLELIGPDDWPYRNGEYNVVTREIVVLRDGADF